MTLRVTQVLNPAAGVDWSYTIPGRWLLDVVAVTATLAELNHPAVFVDATGNGHDATVNGFPNFGYGVAGPFAGGALNRGVSFTGNVNGFAQAYAASTADNIVFPTSPISSAGWVKVSSAPVHGNMGIYGTGDNPILFTAWEPVATNVAGATYQCGILHTPGSVFNFAFTPTTNVWHHLAFTWDGATWTFYVDGVNKGTHVGQGPGGGTFRMCLYGGGDNNVAIPGAQAGTGVWFALLSAADVATLAGAGASNAAYRAAALALAPEGLWMMDEISLQGSRTAALEITDGTDVVADYPGGTLTGTGSSFVWTWATSAPGTGQSANASVNFVQIPDLLLPGGYTLGTRTLDLVATDQWTNISIWWDDSRSRLDGPIVYRNVLIDA